MDEKLLGHEGGDVPGGEILESYEAHEVVASLGVIPRTRSILPEYKPCRKLPDVRPSHVDEAAQQERDGGVVVAVELLDNEAPDAVDEQRPDARAADERPVLVDHEVPDGGEEDLDE